MMETRATRTMSSFSIGLSTKSDGASTRAPPRHLINLNHRWRSRAHKLDTPIRAERVKDTRRPS